MSSVTKSANSFIALPADSIGKRLVTGKFFNIRYVAATRAFVVGEMVHGGTSMAVAQIANVFPTDSVSGTLCLLPQDSGSTSPFQAGEALHVDDIQVAMVTEVLADTHAQRFQLVSRENPYFTQSVDKDGAAMIRFTEGQQQLDAYGLSRMVQPKLMASYNFKYDEEPEDFEKVTAGGGLITYDSVSSGIKLEVGTAAGDKAAFTSNVYYPIWPGCGQLITMVVALGDSGKTGCRIRWGYFNKDNGVFFERDGETLYVVKRSNIDGTVRDERWAQSAWNQNKLDGVDDMSLDETLVNVYWYNIHTLTGGRMRYGVVDGDGFRVTVHNEVDLNTSFLPTFRNMALPMRVEIENTELTPSSSVVKFHAGNVFAEGPTDNLTDSAISRFSSGHLQYGNKTLADGTEKPVMSFRAGKTFRGVENRMVSVPIGFSLYCSAPVRVRLYKNTTLTGANWEPAGPYTPVEKDETASAINPASGRTVHSAIYAAGAYNVDLDPNVWGPRGECMTIKGDTGDFGDTYTCTMQNLDPAAVNTTVAFAGRWKDIG